MSLQPGGLYPEASSSKAADSALLLPSAQKGHTVPGIIELFGFMAKVQGGPTSACHKQQAVTHLYPGNTLLRQATSQAMASSAAGSALSSTISSSCLLSSESAASIRSRRGATVPACTTTHHTHHHIHHPHWPLCLVTFYLYSILVHFSALSHPSLIFMRLAPILVTMAKVYCVSQGGGWQAPTPVMMVYCVLHKNGSWQAPILVMVEVL